MHDCIVRLLRSSSNEEFLECFCRLITITGKELDHQKGKVRYEDFMYTSIIIFSVVTWLKITKFTSPIAIDLFVLQFLDKLCCNLHVTCKLDFVSHK